MLFNAKQRLETSTLEWKKKKSQISCLKPRTVYTANTLALIITAKFYSIILSILHLLQWCIFPKVNIVLKEVLAVEPHRRKWSCLLQRASFRLRAGPCKMLSLWHVTHVHGWPICACVETNICLCFCGTTTSVYNYELLTTLCKTIEQCKSTEQCKTT